MSSDQCQVYQCQIKSVLFLQRSEEQCTSKEVLVLLIHYSYVTEIIVIIIILKTQKTLEHHYTIIFENIHDRLV